MNRKILVLSPHPDDEAIGCGGAILNHVAEGDQVDTVFLTSGEGGGVVAFVRESEALRAALILGTANQWFWRQPDGELTVDEETQGMLMATLSIGYDRVYLPHANEAHPDHRATHALVEAVWRQLPNQPPEAYQYEIWTPLAWPDLFTDIKPVAGAKMLAMQAHQSQMLRTRFDDAILGLNRYRSILYGGSGYHEAFLRFQI